MMKSFVKSASLIMAIAILFSSCASTTLINSSPTGADFYLEGAKRGTTPYTYRDTKAAGSRTNISFKKDGYEDLNAVLRRNERADVGAIIGGVFLLIPFIWTTQYDKTHLYELKPLTNKNADASKEQSSNSTNELAKLKTLLDKGDITQDDFTTIKVKILNNEYDYSKSIVDQIIKLKELYDSNLLTKDEYVSQINKLVNGK